MNNIYQAPESGIMYALYIDRMVFQTYVKEELLKDPELETNLLEMHLFDDTKEYRYIKTRSKREHPVDFVIEDSGMDYDDTYEESVYVQKNPAAKKVTIVNYIKYNENDFLTFTNYRLKQEVNHNESK